MVGVIHSSNFRTGTLILWISGQSQNMTRVRWLDKSILPNSGRGGMTILGIFGNLPKETLGDRPILGILGNLPKETLGDRPTIPVPVGGGCTNSSSNAACCIHVWHLGLLEPG